MNIKRFRWLIVGLILVVVGIACDSSSGASSPDVPAYAGGRSACAKFQRLIGQVSGGIVNDVELREKLKAIQSNGSTAEPTIRDASTAMLRGSTRGDNVEFVLGIEAMQKACSDAGYWRK